MSFRQMRRFKQQLDRDECVRILSEEKRGVLSLLSDDGYPYGVPMNFFYEDGTIFFHGASQGHKLDCIHRRDKACFTVFTKGERPEDDWAYYVKSVICFGRIRILTDPGEILDKCRKLGRKYYPDAESVEEEIKKDGHRVMMLSLCVEHMTGKRVHEK